MKRLYWMAGAGLLLTAVPACGDSTGSSGVTGLYQLVEMNTLPLPYNDQAGCCIYTAGSLSLTASGYSVSITYQNKSNATGGGLNEQGTYTMSGSALFFERTGGNFTMYFYSATVNGRLIRLQLGGSGPGAGDQFAVAFRR